MIPNNASKKAIFLRLLYFGLIIGLIAFVNLSNYFVNQEKNLKNKIYPNVYVDNVAVGKKTKTEALSLFTNKSAPLKKFSLTVLYKSDPIATFSATQLNVHSDISDIVDRAYLIGRVSYLPSRFYQKVSTILNFDSFRFSTKINYDRSVIEDFSTQAQLRFNKPAKNALFKFENNRVVSFKPEEKGVIIESESFTKDSDKAISDLKEKIGNKTVVLHDKVIAPEVTLAEVNEFGIEELIGEGQSNYSHSIPERIHNLTLAASRLNGVLVPKGEEFSFNQLVGEISGLTGYRQAYVIKSGKTVLDDGGGVCQISTTLFRAALNSGLPITARTAHAYRVGYYENDSQPGLDATVFAPYVDFRFKNDTPAAILIETEFEQENNIIRFKFFGQKDGRKAERSPVKVWDVVPPLPEIRQDDPTLKKGVVKQVDFPAWGAKTTFHYKVIKGNNVLFEKEFFSNFRPWQAVYLVGTAD